MDWKLFIALVVLATIIFGLWMFFAQRQVAYLSVLLYRLGRAEEYLAELEKPLSKFFFSKRLRTLMKVDAYLHLGDHQALEKIFDEVHHMHMRATDMFLVLNKEFLYAYHLEDMDRMAKIYERLVVLFEKLPNVRKTKLQSMMDESMYLYTIHVKKDGQYASHFMDMGKQIDEPLLSGLFFVKAAQSYYLKNDLERCENALNHAKSKLKDTVYFKELDHILVKKTFADVLNIR